MNDPTTHSLTVIQKIALAFIRQQPGCTVEDVLNFMVPFDDADDLREQLAGEIGWLIANDYLEKNPRNYGLSVRVVPAAPETPR